MSASRELRRRMERKQAKILLSEHRGEFCPRCMERMVAKSGYGLVCMECGHVSGEVTTEYVSDKDREYAQIAERIKRMVDKPKEMGT